MHAQAQAASARVDELVRPSELDTRPAPPARDAFVYEVAACPSCGLVFEPLPWEETEWVEDAPGLRSLLAGAGYRSPDRQLPEPAALFRRASLIAQHNHQHARAGWALVKAAWACDDAQTDQDAVDYRLAAVRCFRAAEAAGQPIAEPTEASGLLLADLLRRAGRFDDALEQCERTIAAADVDLFIGLAAQERALIHARDSAAHTAQPPHA